jgi:HSP20 family molecular chaperone IbpA
MRLIISLLTLALGGPATAQNAPLPASSQMQSGTEITFHQHTIPAGEENPNAPPYLAFQSRVNTRFTSLTPQNNIALKKEKDGGLIEILLQGFNPADVRVSVVPPSTFSILGKKEKSAGRGAIVGAEQKELVQSDTLMIHETVDVGTLVDLSKAAATMKDGRLFIRAPYAPEGFTGVTQPFDISIVEGAPAT